jgi:hypothetical protein
VAEHDFRSREKEKLGGRVVIVARLVHLGS